MELFLSGPAFRYECENLCRLFFPYSPVKVELWEQPLPPSPAEGPWAWTSIESIMGQDMRIKRRRTGSTAIIFSWGCKFILPFSSCPIGDGPHETKKRIFHV